MGPNSPLKCKFSLVKPKHLKAQLLDIYDTVRIIILHVMSCILFVSSCEVARVWMFGVCDHIEELCNYNWGHAILAYLMKYVDTKNA